MRLITSHGALVGYRLASSEYIYSNGTVAEGPTMPFGRQYHCSVTLHDGKVMLIGGLSKQMSMGNRNVMVFDPNSNSFHTQPSLLYGRYYHACTLFSSAKHGDRPVVLIVGGLPNQRIAQILDYTASNARWEQSKLFFSLNFAYLKKKANDFVSFFS